MSRTFTDQELARALALIAMSDQDFSRRFLEAFSPSDQQHVSSTTAHLSEES